MSPVHDTGLCEAVTMTTAPLNYLPAFASRIPGADWLPALRERRCSPGIELRGILANHAARIEHRWPGHGLGASARHLSLLTPEVELHLSFLSCREELGEPVSAVRSCRTFLSFLDADAQRIYTLQSCARSALFPAPCLGMGEPVGGMECEHCVHRADCSRHQQLQALGPGHARVVDGVALSTVLECMEELHRETLSFSLSHHSGRLTCSGQGFFATRTGDRVSLRNEHCSLDVDGGKVASIWRVRSEADASPGLELLDAQGEIIAAIHGPARVNGRRSAWAALLGVLDEV